MMSKLSHRFDRIMRLPIRKQVRCLLIASEKALPIWENWESAHNKRAKGRDLLEACEKWINEETTSQELKLLIKRFHVLVQTAQKINDDPIAIRVGFAIDTVPLIALQQCKDVAQDMFVTAVLYAANAMCNIDNRLIAIDFDQLPLEVVSWLDDWWDQCCRQIRELCEPV